MEPSETASLTQKAALTRQRILDTALQLFATKGYEGTLKTTELLQFVHELLGRIRPLLRLPRVAQTVVRLVRIVGPLLGQSGTASTD